MTALLAVIVAAVALAYMLLRALAMGDTDQMYPGWQEWAVAFIAVMAVGYVINKVFY